ncbi:hypothetical protein A2U01_0087163, partial [Trifolium medium]|nr:hypothetical protein [Trifolium medium]
VKFTEEIETIYISSDEEEVQVVEEVKELVGEWCWSKDVTKAIGNWRKPQTLVSIWLMY